MLTFINPSKGVDLPSLRRQSHCSLFRRESGGSGGGPPPGTAVTTAAAAVAWKSRYFSFFPNDFYLLLKRTWELQKQPSKHYDPKGKEACSPLITNTAVAIFTLEEKPTSHGTVEIQSTTEHLCFAKVEYCF